jgi:hypothetical protein
MQMSMRRTHLYHDLSHNFISLYPIGPAYPTPVGPNE